MSNTIILVTGGTSGIGKSVAIEFAKSGHSVIICGTNPNGNLIAEEISKVYGSCTFFRTDVSNFSEVEQLFHCIEEQYGQLDCLCCAAGTDRGIGVPTASIAAEDFDAHLDINLKGTWHCMKLAIPMMLRQSRGAIVNISSINGLGGTVGAAAYSASKHAVIGLSKSAALEYAHEGIRINVVCPGMTDTPMLRRVFSNLSPDDPSAVESHFANSIPVKRIGTAEEIAATVYTLCSDSSSFITGQCMVVDGGLSAQFR